MSILKWDKVGFFAAGMVFATKGVELLQSKDLHKVYVKTTAAALRGRDDIMESVTSIREGCEDIYAEAVDYNEDRAAEKAINAETLVIEDKSAAAASKTAAAKSAAKASSKKAAARKTTAKKTAKK